MGIAFTLLTVLMKNSLLQKVNAFCYGQVDSRYGSGQFITDCP